MRYAVFKVGALSIRFKREFETAEEARIYAKKHKGCTAFDTVQQKAIDNHIYPSMQKLMQEFGSEFEAKAYLKQCELEYIRDEMRIAKFLSKGGRT